ncbi:MAG: hypothetical protein JWR70_1076 [Modestobacter sp.]|jgi:hypothetical protein|nr:hypothetical protein [Modestobacter sp.]
MAARLWTALLMLAAVFAMHGLQCTSAADESHTAGGMHAASVLSTASVAADGHSPADPFVAMAVTHTAVMPMNSAAPPATDLVEGSPGAGHGDPHGSTGHLWTLCLAVLATGLAVLLALLVPRLLALTIPALHRARDRAPDWLAPVRAPDLHALCILRT